VAVAVDAVKIGDQNPSTTATTEYTCTGSDLLLVVSICRPDNGINIVGVTYNGVALTELYSADANQYAPVDVWYLIGPATGTHDVVTTFASDIGASGFTIRSFTGVDQSTPLGPVASDYGYGANKSVAVTSVSGDLVIDAMRSASAAPTVDGSQTQDSNRTYAGVYQATSYETASGVSTTMSWTHIARWSAIVGVAIKPVAAGGESIVVLRRRRM